MVLNGNVDQFRQNLSVTGVTEKGICWLDEQLWGAKYRLRSLKIWSLIFV